MTAILALLGKVPMWVWLALVAAGVIGWQHFEVSHYKSQNAALKLSVSSYRDASKTNLDTIAELRNAVVAWSNKYKADMALGKFYADAANEYAQQQQAKAAAAQAKLRALYAHDPKARAWADVAVPPSVADSLRSGANR